MILTGIILAYIIPIFLLHFIYFKRNPEIITLGDLWDDMAYSEVLGLTFAPAANICLLIILFVIFLRDIPLRK